MDNNFRILNFITILLVLTTFNGLLFSQPVKSNSRNWHDYLDNLTGRWALTGSMGTVDLHQHCVGNWVLQRNFFRLHCSAVDPDTSGYASTYLIGYNREAGHYVFHLFDVYGGAYSETMGTGTLDGDRISFMFNYPQGSFKNTFIWEKTEEEWTMVLRQKNSENQWELFAEKKLRKVGQ